MECTRIYSRDIIIYIYIHTIDIITRRRGSRGRSSALHARTNSFVRDNWYAMLVSPTRRPLSIGTRVTRSLSNLWLSETKLGNRFRFLKRFHAIERRKKSQLAAIFFFLPRHSRPRFLRDIGVTRRPITSLSHGCWSSGMPWRGEDKHGAGTNANHVKEDQLCTPRATQYLP